MAGYEAPRYKRLDRLSPFGAPAFIMAANSWMQHPVGYRFNPDTDRAELVDFWAVMFNKVQLVTFPHVIFAAYMTAGTFLLGVAAYLYMKKKHEADRPMYHRAIRIGAVVTLLAGIGVGVTGDLQGKVMTEVQPMKMAAAEGLYETSESCAPFSVFTIGTPDGKEEKFAVTVPCLLSFLGTGSFDGTVEGINPLREEYVEEFGSDPTSKAFTAGPSRSRGCFTTGSPRCESTSVSPCPGKCFSVASTPADCSPRT